MQRWMEIAGGAFGWSEDQFWTCSLQYFMATLSGYLERIGQKKTEAPTRDEYEETLDTYSAELAMTSEDLRRLREKQKKAD